MALKNSIVIELYKTVLKFLEQYYFRTIYKWISIYVLIVYLICTSNIIRFDVFMVLFFGDS